MSRPTKPGNIERGWNDPPIFLYNSGSGVPVEGATAATSKRQPLTKRIAFGDAATSSVPNATPNAASGPKDPPNQQICPHPESSLLAKNSSNSSGVSEENHSQVQLFPPSNTTELPQFVAPIIVPTMVHGSASDGVCRPIPLVATNPVSGVHVAAHETADGLQIPNFDDDEQMFHYVITRLQRALKDCQTVVEPKIVDDIQKKVNILSDMWKNGKVSYPVKSTMARLSTAIHRRQCTIAHELHLCLMIDHVSEVSKWLVGIKRLIQEVEKVEQPLSPSSSCFPVEVDLGKSDVCLSDGTVGNNPSPLQGENEVQLTGGTSEIVALKDGELHEGVTPKVDSAVADTVDASRIIGNHVCADSEVELHRDDQQLPLSNVHETDLPDSRSTDALSLSSEQTDPPGIPSENHQHTDTTL